MYVGGETKFWEGEVMPCLSSCLLVLVTKWQSSCWKMYLDIWGWSIKSMPPTWVFVTLD